MQLSGKKRCALCLVDGRDPIFLSLYVTFEVHFAFTMADVRQRLFSNSYDVVIVDLAVWKMDGVAFINVIQRVGTWIPVLGLFTSDTKNLLEKIHHDVFIPCDKEAIQQRIDDIATRVILQEEQRLKETCGPVSPLFVEQYDGLVRRTNALYHQKSLLLSLDEFVAHLLEIMPDVVASVFYARRATAATFSLFPLSSNVLAKLKKEIATTYGDLSGRPFNLEDLSFEHSGVVSEEGASVVSLGPCTATPVLERGALTGLLLLWRASAMREKSQAVRYQEKFYAKYLHEAFILFNEIRNRAITDSLSGLYNYGFLCEHLKKMWDLSRRQQSRIGVLMFDIDHFKHVNESYGHPVGDKVMKDLAAIANDVAGPEDIVARFQSGEYVMVLSDTTQEKALKTADLILQRVRKHIVQEVGFSLRLTVSIGVAISGTMNERNETHLLEMASKALTTAKQSGRNQVCNAADVYGGENRSDLMNAPAAEDMTMKGGHVLIVDDDMGSLETMKKFCELWDYDVTCVNSARKAIEIVQSSPAKFDLVLTDINMPEMNGIEMVKVLSTIDPDIVTVTVTGYGNAVNTVEAMRAGVYNLIHKPFTAGEMEIIVKRAIERRHLLKQRRIHNLYLEEKIQEKTRALETHLAVLKDSYIRTLEYIVSVLDVHGPIRTEHSRRVSDFSVFLSQKMGIDDDKMLTTVKYAALLHDIGKIGVSENILRKPGDLTAEETDKLRDHVVLGQKIVATIPMLTDAAELIHMHHEHEDGTGYPRGLHGDQMPLGAKILVLANVFDLWRFDREAQRGHSLKEVVEMINAQSGTWFAPEVVRAFNNCYEELDNLFMENENFWENMEFVHSSAPVASK
jgi:putative two-component system response regulator